MCLIAFAIDAATDRPFLLAANRDESFERPTAPLQRWALPGGQPLVSGRDLKDGGTWLGASLAGRVAMLTNVRGNDPWPARRSRGQLPLRWLRGDLGWDQLLASVRPEDYAGFNLVAGDFHRNEWGWLSNRQPDNPHAEQVSALHHRRLAPGVYGLSNAALDTPWPKTCSLTHAMRLAVEQSAFDAERTLLQALASPVPGPGTELPSTGVPAAIEKALSSPFVHLPQRQYGTRSSLLMRVERPANSGMGTWRVQLDEWTHQPPEPGQPHQWSGRQRATETLTWLRPGV
ncbi:MAG: NRDE family protein [Hydrogenophaga sp.]|nr:NRDE family protein [Hydrogenophaga sp.]